MFPIAPIVSKHPAKEAKCETNAPKTETGIEDSSVRRRPVVARHPCESPSARCKASAAPGKSAVRF